MLAFAAGVAGDYISWATDAETYGGEHADSMLGPALAHGGVRDSRVRRLRWRGSFDGRGP